MSSHQRRWQWQPFSENRWQWMPEDTNLQLSFAPEGESRLALHWEPLGSVEVDLSNSTVCLAGEPVGKVRQVPSWWGDPNLAAGVLVASQDEATEQVDFLLGVESRPWWPTRQVGPLWGLVDPEDEGLTAAMAREASEEGLGVVGSEEQLQACLDSETSVPVSFWPWQAADGPRPAVLRMVNLGTLSRRQRNAVAGVRTLS